MNCAVLSLKVIHIPMQKALRNAEIEIEILVHPDDADLYRIHKQPTRNMKSSNRGADVSTMDSTVGLDSAESSGRRRLWVSAVGPV